MMVVGRQLRSFSWGPVRALQASNRSTHRSDRRPWTGPSALPIGILLAGTLGLVCHRHLGPDASEETLQVERYRPFKIAASRLLTPDAALLALDLRLPALDPAPSLLYIQSLYLKHPALQIERPYTPLSSLPPSQNSNDPNQLVDLLVKRYADGDMSTYLHHVRAPGNQLEIRGPVPTWHYPKHDQIDELIFIAAGTGITPALQLLRRFFKPATPHNRHDNLPKFKLIYLASSPQSAYFLDELQSYRLDHPELMDLKLLVNKKEDGCSLNKLVDKVGRLEFADIKKWVGNHEQERRKMIVICGPESLICAVAGCKGRTYNSQGELGGMLKSLGYSSNQVVKL